MRIFCRYKKHPQQDAVKYIVQHFKMFFKDEIMVNSYFTHRTEWLLFVTKRYHLQFKNRINENCNIWYSRLYCFFIACLAELRCFNCQTELAYPRACPFVRKCNSGEVDKLIHYIFNYPCRNYHVYNEIQQNHSIIHAINRIKYHFW